MPKNPSVAMMFCIALLSPAGWIFNATLNPMINVIAICVGASAGALARWQLGLWLNSGAALPWGTLAANLIGGYLVGVCMGVFNALPQLDPVWRVALITGFLGALTTFSSFSAEVVSMLQQSRYALALGTAALHLLGSLLLTVLGLKTAVLFMASRA
jgi:fluoride exporter